MMLDLLFTAKANRQTWITTTQVTVCHSSPYMENLERGALFVLPKQILPRQISIELEIHVWD